MGDGLAVVGAFAVAVMTARCLQIWMTYADTRRRALGPGVVLVVVYGVLALAATGRSILQITTAFDEAPLAYSLSAPRPPSTSSPRGASPGGRWVRVGVAACAFELVGVLVVGAASSSSRRRSPTGRSGRSSAGATAWCRSCCRSSGCSGSATWTVRPPPRRRGSRRHPGLLLRPASGPRPARLRPHGLEEEHGDDGRSGLVVGGG